MTRPTDVEQAAWKAPSRDGEVLVWPSAGRLEHWVKSLWKPIASGGGEAPAWLGVAVEEIRAATRRFLGHVAEAPLLATGHQVELHHPGVWVKLAVVHQMAERWGGRAFHLAVDTDQPKHLALTYPVCPPAAKSAARVSLPVTDDPLAASARWTGRLAGPSPAHATRLERQVLEDHRPEVAGFEPVCAEFLRALRLQALEDGPLAPMLTSALHRLDWELGLRYDAILASPLWLYEGFLLLVLRVLTDPVGFAGAYNRALSAFRLREGVTDPGRPMPDLVVRGEDEVELPFWLDHELKGLRRRASARRVASGWRLELWDGEAFELPAGVRDGWEAAGRLSRLLRQAGQRLAPRAVMLTTFARLLVADVFVHGIGGARYDRVTDHLLSDSVGGLGLEPPPYAVATATLYHPWAEGRSRSCVSCLRHALHHARHNALGPSKSDYLRQLSQLPRRTRARRAVFDELRAAMHAAEAASPQVRELGQKLKEAVESAKVDELVFDRELFYGLQPRARLERLLEQVAGTVQSPD